eukprot:CAMPEP_0115499624 /NCGR_PEP_ID=MMETSP0271-20121206/67438_1 /TAXON_ID=71861 /ORGANISM="Scrippsiella trochoidea, Strain CCMP3099" /LENGTH=106 /DNA_ID=CAMNT_0002928453 /DNA_START=519 /DNA_END=836 /DNA_ORIENTATION=+
MEEHECVKEQVHLLQRRLTVGRDAVHRVGSRQPLHLFVVYQVFDRRCKHHKLAQTEVFAVESLFKQTLDVGRHAVAQLAPGCCGSRDVTARLQTMQVPSTLMHKES